jgi:hypothetical protein
MENYNPYRVIVHLHVFIDVAFRPEDRELTIELLHLPLRNQKLDRSIRCSSTSIPSEPSDPLFWLIRLS